MELNRKAEMRRKEGEKDETREMGKQKERKKVLELKNKRRGRYRGTK